MAQMINDADALHKFENDLQRASDELKTALNQANFAIERVHDTWKDSQFEQFQTKFNQSSKDVIVPLCKDMETYKSQVLAQLEKKVREYLSL